ncbi:MAG: hypothetical protein PHD07_02060 [Bacteroidales bacterium]|jgi:hypothetical protein|nr:hypothetical protein [Bacteroidales bacterium]MDD3200625.1 hypothetical protein [Bacteroidales bacterium]
MKRIFTIAACVLAIALLSGCSKLKKDSDLLIGTWTSTVYYSSSTAEGQTWKNMERLIFKEDGTVSYYDSIEGKIIWTLPFVYSDTNKTLTITDGTKDGKKNDVVYNVLDFQDNLLKIDWKEYIMEYSRR